MVRTGARAEELKRILATAGLVELEEKPPAPRIEMLAPRARENLLELYRAMGGVVGAHLRPGSWDIAYGEQLVVELDEGMHFTRYRARTLGEPWANALPWTEPYLGFCADWEHLAGTGGRRWTNPSAERMFGPADPDGHFGDHGAPRWKQRACYDAMKDAYAASGAVRLARISIYDVVDGVLLEDVLRHRKTVDPAAILEHVNARTSSGEQ